MKGRVDMTDVPEGGTFKVPPPGIYNCEIHEAVDKQTKNGDPMVSIKLIIVDGDFAGKFLWDNILFMDAILGRTKHFLHCIGCEYEGEFEWDSEEWLYKKIDVKTKIEPPNNYHDYDRAVVSRYILNEKKEEEADEDDIPFP